MVKDIFIKNPVRPRFFSSYVIEITYMHGDADHYQTEESTYPSSARHILIEHLNFLERCIMEYPYGRGGGDSYCEVEGYDEFVDYWPCDECGIEASIDGYKVFFYDSNGVKIDCEVVNE